MTDTKWQAHDDDGHWLRVQLGEVRVAIHHTVDDALECTYMISVDGGPWQEADVQWGHYEEETPDGGQLHT